MKPKNSLITIKNNNKELIKKLLDELVLTPRLKALEWSKITKQTPNMKIGYPGQHLASLVIGMEGSKTGTRGNDIVDGSEVKSCSRVDQLDTCAECGEKVLRIENICPACKSKNIKRMNDSKWLFTIRNENDLEVLTKEVDRIILTLADYPDFESNNFENIRFQVFEIWTKSSRNQNFVSLMTNYYNKIYLEHKKKNVSKTPAPKNFWPYSYQFYMCNPIKVFNCIVKNANTKPKIDIDFYIEPDFDRKNAVSENMPIDVLNANELEIISNLPVKVLKTAITTDKKIQDFKELFEDGKPNIKKVPSLLPFVNEEIRKYFPLRDTDKISTAKSQYKRKKN